MSTILIQALEQQNILNPEQIQQLHTRHDIDALIPYLISRYKISAQKIAQACATYFNLHYQDLHQTLIQELPRNVLPNSLMKEHHILPLQKTGSQIKIAIYNPDFLQHREKIQFQIGLQIIPIITDYDVLMRLLNTWFSEQQYALAASVTNHDESPVTAYIEQLLNDAIGREASDIHLEIYSDHCRIRLRIDGLLHDITHPPASLYPALISRLKIMAELDIAEKRLPQDGRFHFKAFNHQARDCRVSTCPTLLGEKIVVRILETQHQSLLIDELGMNTSEQKIFQDALNKSQGLIIVTGPTGSGKTITLYTALQMLNEEIHNIITIEDPVEIQIAGINQVHVNHKAGLNFAKALRSFLRQDPDIIMVGEIRDQETAEVAIRAAQTGHLVLTTLHTNSAAETLIRLFNMGIEPINIASSVILIIAQRLARKLCPYCKTHDETPILKMPTPIYRAGQCAYCTKGYKGRSGIFELMPNSKKLTELMLRHGDAPTLAAQAQQEGMNYLWQSALDKVSAGITSLEEIFRVAQ